jgi:hypothetical protein
MRRKRSKFLVVSTAKSDAKAAGSSKEELQARWGYTKPHDD